MKFTKEFDEWNECTGALNKASSWYAECRSIVIEADNELTRLRAENLRMREALEGLTNAALAGLKPLPSQIEAGFYALSKSPATAATAKRIEAMERVVEASRELSEHSIKVGTIKIQGDEMYQEIPTLSARLGHKVKQALDALEQGGVVG